MDRPSFEQETAAFQSQTVASIAPKAGPKASAREGFVIKAAATEKDAGVRTRRQGAECGGRPGGQERRGFGTFLDPPEQVFCIQPHELTGVVLLGMSPLTGG